MAGRYFSDEGIELGQSTQIVLVRCANFYVILIEPTKTYYPVKLQQNLASNFKVIDSFLIQTIRKQLDYR